MIKFSTELINANIKNETQLQIISEIIQKNKNNNKTVLNNNQLKALHVVLSQNLLRLRIRFIKSEVKNFFNNLYKILLKNFFLR